MVSNTSKETLIRRYKEPNHILQFILTNYQQNVCMLIYKKIGEKKGPLYSTNVEIEDVPN